MHIPKRISVALGKTLMRKDNTLKNKLRKLIPVRKNRQKHNPQ